LARGLHKELGVEDMMRIALVCALPIALGCSSTTVAHHTLSPSSGTAAEMGFGTGTSSVVQSSIGSSNSTTDVRVEHAADVTPDGAIPRFWRVTFVEADKASVLREQRLELCAGTPSAPGSCMRAKIGAAPKETEVTGLFPTLLENGNLGGSLRAQSGSSTVWAGTTAVKFEYSSVAGDLKRPIGRRATKNFGVWVLTAPVGVEGGPLGIANLMRTGGLLFCHAPGPGEARCYPAPQSVARVLSVHVLRRGGSIRHVVWGQSTERGTWSEKLVRCEADDETAAPTCVTVEVPK
jgi:hypothetical protein